MSGFDPQHSGFNPWENVLTPAAAAAGLKPKWTQTYLTTIGGRFTTPGNGTYLVAP